MNLISRNYQQRKLYEREVQLLIAKKILRTLETHMDALDGEPLATRPPESGSTSSSPSTQPPRPQSPGDREAPTQIDGFEEPDEEPPLRRARQPRDMSLSPWA